MGEGSGGSSFLAAFVNMRILNKSLLRPTYLCKLWFDKVSPVKLSEERMNQISFI